MTTKELENKLKISKNTCIHCPTLFLAKQVLSIFHHLGLKWCTGTHYTICTNWDSNKENTVYHPFDGEFSSLEFAPLISYKIINAKEFIALHTEGEEFILKNYFPKWELEGFPKEIIARMLECQEEQGNKKDITVFEKKINAGMDRKGFFWRYTKEKFDFWNEVIFKKNFNLFFEKYPQRDIQDNSQKFKEGDEVIDIITRQKGKILQIKTDNRDYPIYVGDKEKSYTLDGRYYMDDRHPRLLHYREDYDYSIIDFNNLPKRQDPKKWREEKGRLYYCVRFDAEGWSFADEIRDIHGYNDNANYNSGNYFRTEIEAEIIAQKLNSYMKQLIQEEHERD